MAHSSRPRARPPQGAGLARRWRGGRSVLRPGILLLLFLSTACSPLPTPSWGGGSGLTSGERTALTGPQVGPPRGSLLVDGGGALGPEIWERFVELAGGPEARIVVIPTAGTDEIFPEDWSGFTPIRSAGASAIRVLHTRDREEADHPEFASLLQWATGVWIPGGRQWRLVDAYLHTRVHDELWALLDRNGVIGGTSAGASIQADFLVRGDPSTNQIMVADGYLEGFGFLVNTAIDQHLLARAREADLWEVLEGRPHLLGIGVDEGTALLVRGDMAEVLGVSQVLFYAWGNPLRSPVALGPGSTVDLAEWRARRMDSADRSFD